MIDNWKPVVAGLALGGSSIGLLWYLHSKWKKDPWNNRQIKENMLELIGHTPIMRVDSLSRAANNEIFVEKYYLDQV